MNNPIHNPHDKFNKVFFGRTTIMSEVSCAVLSQGLVNFLSWQTLSLKPGSFVSEDFRETHSDLLFSINGHNSEFFLYFLFEHDSSNRRTTPLQLLDYKLSIWKQESQKNPGHKLPPIICLVLHQGPGPWRESPHFRDFLFYAFHTDSNLKHSTFWEKVTTIKQLSVKKEFMSFYEELQERSRQEGLEKGRQEGRQEGHQEGLQKGGMIGRIQMHQDLLNLPETPMAELEKLDLAELTDFLQKLQQQLNVRLGH